MSSVKNMIGIARTIPDAYTFVTPVFFDQNYGHVVQRVENSLVVDFEVIDVGEEFVSLKCLTTVGTVGIGSSALYAFQLSDDLYVFGPPVALGKVLQNHVNGLAQDTVAPFSRSTRAAIQRFTDSIADLTVDSNASSKYVRCFRREKAEALVIDDSPTHLFFVKVLLEGNGLHVRTAEDGLDALNVLQDHKPDIILLDVMMPRMGGYELVKRLQSDERFSHIPVVIITSREGKDERERAIELGAKGYLHKPFQNTDLLSNIENLVPHEQWKVDTIYPHSLKT